jgi:archaellum component FlaC
MQSGRTTPLIPLFSSMAILSFKKKGKEGVGDLSGDSDELGLDGEAMSLSDLKAGKLGLSTKVTGADEGMTFSKGKVDDKKFLDFEASIGDIKKQMDKDGLSSKNMKVDIDSMKQDLTQINDSIRSLLNVYEAVSKQYNPFVEQEEKTVPKQRDIPKKVPKIVEPTVFEDEPLDRILKPEGDLIEEIVLPKPQKLPDKKPESKPIARPMPEPLVELTKEEEPKAKSGPTDDDYVLCQVEKLVVYQMEKIHRSKLKGARIQREDIETLDRWLNEYKRLGVD